MAKVLTKIKDPESRNQKEQDSINRRKIQNRVRSLAHRATAVPGSAIHIISQAVEEYEQRTGQKVLRLHLGDPDFLPPAAVISATEKALRTGKTHYSIIRGIRELRERCARKLHERNQISDGTAEKVNPERITITQGSTQALGAVLQLTVDRGERMLYPEIFWPNYLQQAMLLEIEPTFYPLTNTYQPDLTQFEKSITRKTKAVLINSPSNPTGAVFPKETLLRLYEIATRHDLWIISDEAYEDFNYTAERFCLATVENNLPESARRIFSVFSFSKSYAMTGFRLGYVLSPSVRAATILNNLQVPLTGSISTPTQYGALAAFEELESIEIMKQTYQRRRDIAISVLQTYGMEEYIPQGAFYLMVDIGKTGLSGDEFALQLLTEKGVSVAQGSGFGFRPEFDSRGQLQYRFAKAPRNQQDDFASYPVNPRAATKVRVSFCVADDQLREGMQRLCQFYQSKLSTPSIGVAADQISRDSEQGAKMACFAPDAG